MPAIIDPKEELSRAVRALGVDLLELLTSIRDQIVVLDRQQRTVAIFGEWPPELWQRPADFIGKTFRKMFGSQMAAVHDAAHSRALHGEHVAYEWTIPRDRQPVRFSTVVSPLRDSSSKIVGLVCVTRNITPLTEEEKRLEQSITQKTQQLLALEQGVRLLTEVIQNYRKRDGGGPPSVDPSDYPLRQLSSRERQVLDLLGKGYRPRSIAEALHVSPETVRNHLKAMFKKTGTHSQEELIAMLRSSAGIS